jgi:hypothetical protein
MKRLLLIPLVVLTFTGCGDPPGTPQGASDTITMGRTLVQMCSAHGGVQSHTFFTTGGHSADRGQAICHDGEVFEVRA